MVWITVNISGWTLPITYANIRVLTKGDRTMKTVYIVTVNGKISQLAYETLAEAQQFIENRFKVTDLDNQGEYYNLFSSVDCLWYKIEDVKYSSGL